jgi:mannose-6-phosphate isomerase-like protein (cupin superfamily)
MSPRERRAAMRALQRFRGYDLEMKRANINDTSKYFTVLQTAEKSQIATMRLASGKSSGPKGNEHPNSEQVLFVVEGEILAEIGDERALLRRGDCVIVPRKIAHKFSNLSASPAVTFNVYAPPAYDADEGQ